jgi:hypothetical protein
MMGLRRQAVLPEPPLGRLYLYTRPQVHIDPLAHIGVQARKRNQDVTSIFRDLDFKFLVAGRRRCWMPMGVVLVLYEVVNRMVGPAGVRQDLLFERFHPIFAHIRTCSFGNNSRSTTEKIVCFTFRTIEFDSDQADGWRCRFIGGLPAPDIASDGFGQLPVPAGSGFHGH